MAENITLKRGFTGAKPTAVVRWLLEVLNVQPGDTVDDLFPGSGAVTAALDGWRAAQTGDCNGSLFDPDDKGAAPAATPTPYGG